MLEPNFPPMRMNNVISCSLRQLGIVTSITVAAGLFSSCDFINSKVPTSRKPLEAPQTNANSTASALLAQGQAYQNGGKTRKALSTYSAINKKYPKSSASAEASFAKAQILDSQGDLFKAFEAYQEIVARHQASNRYGPAVKRQEEIAHASADGVIKNNFLGLKSNIDPDRVERMLTQVRNNAPQAPSAAKAQFTIGKVWQQNGSADRALAAYRKVDLDYGFSSYAPEALFQTGEILVLKAEKGNQNKANVNRAREIYQELLLRYPKHPRAKDSRQRLAALGSQDIQRSFDVAEFYRGKGEKESALFYYREVIRKTKAGALHDRAKQCIAELGH